MSGALWWEQDPSLIALSNNQEPVSDNELEEAWQRVGYNHRVLLEAVARSRRNIREMERNLEILNGIHMTHVTQRIWISK